jgi:hypothetical protein
VEPLANSTRCGGSYFRRGRRESSVCWSSGWWSAPPAPTSSSGGGTGQPGPRSRCHGHSDIGSGGMSAATSVTARVPLAIRRRAGRKTIVTPVGEQGVQAVTTRADPALMKALARAFRYQRLLDEGRHASIARWRQRSESSADIPGHRCGSRYWRPISWRRSSMAMLRLPAACRGCWN